MNKTRLKFIGSSALVISTLGVLLAILGQLDFIGNERAEPVAVAATKQKQSNEKKPKYSFYSELKKRKVEIGNQSTTVITTNNTNKQQDDDKNRYVVQAGAFPKLSDANKVEKQLKDLGYAVRIVKAGSMHLVQVGPLTGKTLAKNIEQQLKGKRFPTLIKRLK